jgi:hypothetical protein
VIESVAAMRINNSEQIRLVTRARAFLAPTEKQE